MRNLKGALLAHPEYEAMMRDPLVLKAYEQTAHELSLHCGKNALPLVDDVCDAMIRQCDVGTARGVRFAAWTKLAPPLMQRPHEGVSLLHGDLEHAPGAAAGGWQVPGYTKNTDGVEGRVPRWKHRCGCPNAGRSMHQCMECSESELCSAAFELGTDGRPSLVGTCAVCVVFYMRKLQGLTASLVDDAAFVLQDNKCATRRGHGSDRRTCTYLLDTPHRL